MTSKKTLFLLLFCLVAAPLGAKAQAQPDISFEDFFSELLGELEKEAQSQDQAPKPLPSKPSLPAPMPKTAPSAPASQASDEASSGSIRTDFLGASDTFPDFKAHALETYLRSLRTRMEETVQAIGALDVFERRRFNGHVGTISNAITQIGRVLSKHTYQRALYDKSFNQLRKIIVDLDEILLGVEEEILRRSMEQDDTENIIAQVSSLSPTARVLESISGAFTFDIPTVGTSLAKVVSFATKPIEEKRAMRAQIEKESLEWLKHLEARKPLPYYPARQSYPSRQAPRPAPRTGGYPGYGAGAPYGDYYPGGYNGYDDYDERPAARGTKGTRAKEEKDKKTGKPADDKKPGLKAAKDEIWDEIKKIVAVAKEVAEGTQLLTLAKDEELKIKLKILDAKLSGIDKDVQKVRKTLGTNLKKPITEPTRSTKEEAALKPNSYKNEGPIKNWRANRLSEVAKGLEQLLKKLEGLKKLSATARFNGLGGAHQKLRETRLIIKRLLEDLDKPMTRAPDLGEEVALEKEETTTRIPTPPPLPPVRDWGEPAPAITPQMLQEGHEQLKKVGVSE